jgi:hypothetical protein
MGIGDLEVIAAANCARSEELACLDICDFTVSPARRAREQKSVIEVFETRTNGHFSISQILQS